MTSPAASPQRILEIEDSEPDAELIERQLRRGGLVFEAERVTTEAGLRAALERGPWSVVLSDYSLPQLTGHQALAIVKEYAPDLPFIIVSGSLREDVAVEMMKAGASDFFYKGSLTRLVSAIEREVTEAQRRRERRSELRRAEDERQRLLGELREAVRARDIFLTLAAHELRTPLTGALLRLHGLRRSVRRRLDDGGAADELDRGLALVSRQLSRLSALADNLVQVSQITSGAYTPLRETMDLRDVVAESLASFDEELRASGSTVQVRADGPAEGRWDRAGIRAVVDNLLSNATKYGGGKPVEIVLATLPGRVWLSVADQGEGISEAERERIFNKFEHVVLSHHHSGFGLGLWIVRRIVVAHGGTVRFESYVGQGSTFTVELPTEL
jgi:signal transduction histidine kinase